MRQLSQLETGLALIEKEKYVPNTLGTRSFVDLFARDAHGHFVLIELKRSAASSRDAIHEVLKYVEGVKSHLGARDHEVRALIVSTDWTELLVPFSRFVADSTISVRGLKISVSARNKIKAADVSPLKTPRGRLLAPWHELNFYNNERNLQRGLREYEESCKKKAISDFVLVVLDAPTGLNEAAKDAFRQQMRNMAIQFEHLPDEQHIERLVKKLDDYSSAIYFAMQMLDRDSCLKITARDKTQKNGG